MRLKALIYCFFIFISKGMLGQMPAKVLPLIPLPVQVLENKGSFKLSPYTFILVSDPAFYHEADYLNTYLKSTYGFKLVVVSEKPEKGNYFEIRRQALDSILDDSLSPDSMSDDLKGALFQGSSAKDTLLLASHDSDYYHLTIEKNRICLESRSNVGIFYGLQTTIQLLPVSSSENSGVSRLLIPCLEIKDYPRYKWRGMHLDCSRHFFSTSFIRKYIDFLASYKMNVFHWHLTDDQGWRIEIKQFPRLTEIGSKRKGSMVGSYSDHKFDSIEYGGFYTQEEIKDIVDYAAKLHVNIVPEIEMPGHALAAIAAYPQFSCSGLPVNVGMQWGVETNVFCPTEKTFAFLDSILSEVIALFPSKFIHIGGDEVLKDEWNKSAFCQGLMKQENLKDAHELQAYFIRRIEKMVNAKGRMIIGWDEILEGGLAPNAAVMSWRGTEGGIAAAKQKHFVVMSPGSHCYFDHYQGNPETEPLAIGGYTPLEKTYSYEPTPDELTPEEAVFVMGAQGNVWTEYINTAAQVEYMALPRMAALAEVVWSKKDSRDYQSFMNRILKHFILLDMKKVNYAKSIYELKSKINPGLKSGELSLEFSTVFDPKGIRFTLDGSDPEIGSKKYKAPILIKQNEIIKAAYFEEGKQITKTKTQAITLSRATNKKISLGIQPDDQYKADGAFTLINGIKGNLRRTGNEWLGFKGVNMEATIDLDSMEALNFVTLNVLNKPESWIHPPKKVSVLGSMDSINFTELGSISIRDIRNFKNTITLKFEGNPVRFIKVIAENIGAIPQGNPGENEKAWLFIDEIIID